MWTTEKSYQLLAEPDQGKYHVGWSWQHHRIVAQDLWGSHPTMCALEDGRGTIGHSIGPAESFHLVFISPSPLNAPITIF